MVESASLGVLLDHVQDKIVLLDERGKMTYANDAVEQTLGYEPDDIVGENTFDYIHPDDVAEARDTFERTIAADEFTENTVEYRFRASDGSWVWLESRVSNLTDAALDGYVVSSRDITDRVAAEREQAETATRLQELSAVAGDVLWMFSGDWSELLFVNPAYEDMYGKPVEQLREDPASFIETVHPDDRPRVKEAMERLSEGIPAEMEYRVNPEYGYEVSVWVQAEPIVEEGSVVRITGFSRDVTDRKRRQRQLCVMDKLLRHNLRNDLTTILGQAELIEEQAPETSERVAVIRRTGEELMDSAEKQRDIIDILTTDVRFERRDVRAVVERGVEVVADRFDSAHIDVNGLSSVHASVLPQLHLAVTELVENAVRHSDRSAPQIDVTVRAEDRHVVIEIRDDAPPIPANEAQVLTGEYEMSDIYHSTGLGLWLAYWVLNLMDGRITVDREPAGNRIRLRFADQPRSTPVESAGSGG
ncbi:PAS domain-containing sensor histidine kinase [Haloarcula laminariae]|uniref:PAS domain-containing sensor histidine kinase n=1 Tax=Haloarcula laminariae TaxID=2961577 RepID=UPI0021C7CCC3|nr:PAS domain S-box protein [Halomicroarcula laminariae]